jgi:hypothetical protein
MKDVLLLNKPRETQYVAETVLAMKVFDNFPIELRKFIQYEFPFNLNNDYIYLIAVNLKNGDSVDKIIDKINRLAYNYIY